MGRVISGDGEVPITIKADELAAFSASNPKLGLGRVVDITFDFNDEGEICDCHGRVKGLTTAVSLVGPGLGALANMARRRYLKQLRNLNRKPEGTARILPFQRAVNK